MAIGYLQHRTVPGVARRVFLGRRSSAGDFLSPAIFDLLQDFNSFPINT